MAKPRMILNDVLLKKKKMFSYVILILHCSEARGVTYILQRE